MSKGQYNGQEVELKGWVKRERGATRFDSSSSETPQEAFSALGNLMFLGAETFADLKAILIETSVVFQGTVITSEDAPGGHELQIKSMEIVEAVNSERPFPITESTLKVVDEEEAPLYGGSEFLLNHRHLYLRVGRQTTMLKLRSSAFGAIHNYFRGHEFIEYQAPNFVAGAVEGGSTLFEVPYFDEDNPDQKVYLTQSWQLYAEAAMPALERLYTIAPSFRAEQSRTRRHLTEFWHAEMEMAWATNADIMVHGEGCPSHRQNDAWMNVNKNLPLLIETLNSSLATQITPIHECGMMRRLTFSNPKALKLNAGRRFRPLKGIHPHAGF